MDDLLAASGAITASIFDGASLLPEGQHLSLREDLTSPASATDAGVPFVPEKS